jgi:hypothetical protein
VCLVGVARKLTTDRTNENYNMSATRRFETLDSWELQRLLKLVFEASMDVSEVSPGLGGDLGKIAADVGFELWAREQLGVEQRHEWGRFAGSAEAFAGRSAH